MSLKTVTHSDTLCVDSFDVRVLQGVMAMHLISLASWKKWHDWFASFWSNHPYPLYIANAILRELALGKNKGVDGLEVEYGNCNIRLITSTGFSWTVSDIMKPGMRTRIWFFAVLSCCLLIVIGWSILQQKQMGILKSKLDTAIAEVERTQAQVIVSSGSVSRLGASCRK